MPLLAMLYFVAIGWAVARSNLDRKALEAARGAFRQLARDAAHISLEVHREASGLTGQGWLYVSQHPGQQGWPWDRGVFYMPRVLEEPPVVTPYG